MVDKYGKIDVLVNNAAIQYIVPSIAETGPEIVEDTFRWAASVAVASQLEGRGGMPAEWPGAGGNVGLH